MLIARSHRPLRDRVEVFERIRRNFLLFAERNPDESLFGNAPVSRYVVHLLLLVGAAAALVGMLGVFALGGGAVWAGGLLVLSLVLGGLHALDQRLLRRRYRQENAEVRIALGSVVHGQRHLYQDDNDEGGFVAMFVTMDDESIRDPEALFALTQRLIDLKTNDREYPEDLRPFVERIRAENFDRSERLKVPHHYVGNDSTWMVPVIAVPSDLPNGRMDRDYWPVQLHAHSTDFAPIIPDKELWWEPENELFWYEQSQWTEEEREDAREWLESQRVGAAPELAQAEYEPDLPPTDIPQPAGSDKAVGAGKRQRILEHLRETDRPRIPRPPAFRTALLLGIVHATRVTVFFLMPLLALGLLSIPVILRLAFDVRMHGSISTLLWIAAVGVVVAYVQAWRARPGEEEPPVVLRRSDEPELFELIDAVADAVGAPQADWVTMEAGTSFCVHEEESKGRVNHYLALDPSDAARLDQAELTSILLHEFAHFGEGHTRQSRSLYRNRLFLFALEDELAQHRWPYANPVYWTLLAFRRVYATLYASISRTQELQADAMAVGFLGSDAFTRALPKVIRAGIHTDQLLPRFLHPAIQAPERDTDLLEAVRNQPLDAEDQAAIEAYFHHIAGQTTGRNDTHPSLAERLREAEARAVPTPADVLGGPPAYDALFGPRRLEYQVRVSRALVEAHVGFRKHTVGVRGEGEVPGGRGPAPQFTARRFHPLLLISGLAGSVLSLLVFLGILVVLALDAATRDMVLPTALVCAALGAAAGAFGLAFRVGVKSRAEGLELRGFLRSRLVPWEDVTALVWERDKLSVSAALNGGRRTTTVKGKRRDRDMLGEIVLEHAPVVSWIAWGTGVLGARRPRSSAEALPDGVTESMEGLVVHGPGATHVLFERERSDYEVVKHFVEHRLLPALEPEEPERSVDLVEQR